MSGSMAAKAILPQLNYRMRSDAAFLAVAATCLAQLKANRAGVMAADSESIHQMRVALRRWKSACRLFRNVARVPHGWSLEVDWLAGVLGPARDWDVLANATLGRVPDMGRTDASALEALRTVVDDVAQQKREAAAVAADSARFDRLLDGLLGWLDGIGGVADQSPAGLAEAAARAGAEGARGGAAPGAGVEARSASTAGAGARSQAGTGPNESAQDVGPFAAQALRRDRKRLVRRGRRLARADASTLHRLRIAVKRARYDAEFLQSLHDTPRWRRQLRRLARLQDVLGAMNDATVAAALLAPLASTPQLALAAGWVQGYLTAESQDGRPQAARLSRRVVQVKLHVSGKRGRQRKRTGGR